MSAQNIPLLNSSLVLSSYHSIKVLSITAQSSDRSSEKEKFCFLKSSFLFHQNIRHDGADGIAAYNQKEFDDFLQGDSAYDEEWEIGDAVFVAGQYEGHDAENCDHGILAMYRHEHHHAAKQAADEQLTVGMRKLGRREIDHGLLHLRSLIVKPEKDDAGTQKVQK
jgi:hypothetical protein